MSILNKIQRIKFSDNQFVKEETDKKQIVLHHTVSGDNIQAIANYWNQNKVRVATCIIISRDGTPYQLFSSKYWAYHLGVKKQKFTNRGLEYVPLDKHSIGIEIANWGGLIKKDGKFYNCYAGEVDKSSVYTFDNGFRQFKYYEKYTPAQIQTVKELCEYWHIRYNIPLQYSEQDMWNVSDKALSMYSGIFSHTSYRKDKTDICPQPLITSMLRGLNDY